MTPGKCAELGVERENTLHKTCIGMGRPFGIIAGESLASRRHE